MEEITIKKNRKLCLLVLCLLALVVNGAEITVAYDSDPVSLDPLEQLATPGLQMSHLVFDPLVRKNIESQYMPRLAESWEYVNPTTMRFKIRKGVIFHSGNPMTADDVIWSFHRAQTSPDFKGMFSRYLEMKKIDDYTVDLIIKKPYSLVLSDMTYLFVMDKNFYSGKTESGQNKSDIIKDRGSFASTHASGTGVFFISERQQGVKIIYKKNKNYWGKSGNVDKVTLMPIKEDVTRLSALLSGDVDLISPVAPTNFDKVRKHKGITLLSIPGNRIITLQMNQKAVPEFKDKRVRQAVIYAINNKGIAKKIMRGSATPASQNSPKTYVGHNNNLIIRYNLSKAKQLMKEAGYEKGFTVTMIAPNNRYVNDEKIAQAVVAMLKKINITVNLTTMPKAQYWPEFDKCEQGIQMIGWSSNTEDSANYSEYLTITKNPETGQGQFNCGHYSNKEVDKLVEQANSEIDPQKRAELLKKVSRIEYDDAAFIPLHWQNLAWGYNNKISNFYDNVTLKNYQYLGDLIIKE